MDSLTPGTTLAGRFVIESVLGRGGMGQVLRARDKKLGRTVAIKFLPAALESDDEPGQARLVREARAAAGLSHPNIIQVYDVGETDEGAVYVVMELVAGRSLRSHMEADDLALGDLVRVFVEAARALAAAHARGVIHRDVKPDNIMVRDDGRALVLDFGIAKRVHLDLRPDASAGDTQLTQPGTVVGTPSYLSPEQVTGSTVSGAADQFSLAVTAYEALTGKLPWKNTRPMPLMGEIMMVQPPPPTAADPGLPAELSAVVMRALAKKPEQRFADMDAFADALAPFATPGDPSARTSAQPHAPRPSRVSSAAVAAAVIEPTSRDINVAATQRASTPEAIDARPAAALRAPDATTERRRPAPWGRVAAVGAALFALAGAAVAWRHRPRPAAPSPVAPLERGPDAVACAVFETERPSAEEGWLGAAASDVACDSLGFGLGDPRRIRRAATLLDLPHAPGADVAYDPYADPGARARSLAAARAHPWRLDGRVATAGERFDVTVTLRDAHDAVVARGRHSADDLWGAARGAALGVLATAADLNRPVDPAVAPWLGTSSRRDLLAYTALDEDNIAHSASRSLPHCERLERGEAIVGALSPIALAECRLDHITPGAPAVLPVDRRDPGTFTLTARYHMATNGRADPRALAAELAALPRAEDPYFRSLQVEAQAELAQTLNDPERAREFALAAVAGDPQSDLAWARLVSLAVGDPDPSPVFHAYAGWAPEHPSTWRWLAAGTGDDNLSTERRRDLAARGYRLTPSYMPVAVLYGELLIRAGQTDAARLVAARARADALAPQPLATLDVLLDASEGRFERALARGVEQLGRNDARLGDQPAMLLEAVMELASIVGRRAQVADALADTFVGPEPRISRLGSGPSSLVTVCGACSRARAAACFASADALAARENFLSRLAGNAALDQGARAFARGDYAAATAAWRTIARSANGVFRMARPLLAEAFDRAGDAALAQLVDEALAAEAPAWAGATLAHARLARRAMAAGDAATAHRWGDALLRQWVTAEGVERVLRETRAVLAAGPRP